MFGNENDRLCHVCPARGVAAMNRRRSGGQACAEHSIRRQLPLGPVGERSHCGCDRRAVRPGEYSPACSPPTWGLGTRLRQRIAAAPKPRPFRSEAALQYQRRIRPLARRAAHRASCQERHLLVACRRNPGLRPITGQPADESDLRKVCEAIHNAPVFANTGVTIDNVRDVLAVADGAIVGTHFRSMAIPGTRSMVPREPLHGRRREAALKDRSPECPTSSASTSAPPRRSGF